MEQRPGLEQAWAPRVSVCVCVCVCAHTCIRVCFPGGQDDKESACNAGDLGSIPGSGNPPEKGMASHSSILS